MGVIYVPIMNDLRELIFLGTSASQRFFPYTFYVLREISISYMTKGKSRQSPRKISFIWADLFCGTMYS